MTLVAKTMHEEYKVGSILVAGISRQLCVSLWSVLRVHVLVGHRYAIPGPMLKVRDSTGTTTSNKHEYGFLMMTACAPRT
jgi:hypothetical protein